mgnify:CR=1
MCLLIFYTTFLAQKKERYHIRNQREYSGYNNMSEKKTVYLMHLSLSTVSSLTTVYYHP